MALVILSGFLLGFLGSAHCVGMCGPIVLALPFKSPVRWRFIAKRILYHTGRISVYALFGLMFGFLGDRVQFTNMQHTISIIAGVFILLMGLGSLLQIKLLTKLSFLEKPYGWMKSLLGKYINHDGLPFRFFTWEFLTDFSHVDLCMSESPEQFFIVIPCKVQSLWLLSVPVPFPRFYWYQSFPDYSEIK